MKKMSKKFYQGALSIIILTVIFAGITLKLEKADPTFSSFYSCSFFLSVATGNRKQFQCIKLYMVLSNKTGPLFMEVRCSADKF